MKYEQFIILEDLRCQYSTVLKEFLICKTEASSGRQRGGREPFIVLMHIKLTIQLNLVFNKVCLKNEI